MGGGGAASTYSTKAEKLLGSWADGYVQYTDSGIPVEDIDTEQVYLRFPLTQYMNRALSAEATPGVYDPGGVWQAQLDEERVVAGEDQLFGYGNPWVDSRNRDLYKAYDSQSEVEGIRDAVLGFENVVNQFPEASVTWCQAVAAVTTCMDIDDMFAGYTPQVEARLDPRLREAVTYAPTQIAVTWDESYEGAAEDVLSLTDGTTFDVAVEEAVAAFRDVQRDSLETVTLPRFRAGMRNAGAVRSSAMVIGEAQIEGMFQRDVAKFQSDLRMEMLRDNERLTAEAHIADAGHRANIRLRRNENIANAIAETQRQENASREQQNALSLSALQTDAELNYKQASFRMTMKADNASRVVAEARAWMEMKRTAMHYFVEANRLSYVIGSERNDETLRIREAAYGWDFGVFQHGANLLAGMSGGSMPVGNKPNKAGSTIGGALSGAATGAMIGAESGSVGGGYGAAIGAVVGAIGGYISAS